MEDVAGITALHNKQPELGIPSLHNVLVNSTFVNDKGKVVGYGVLKIFAEAVLIVDKKLGKLSKGKILKDGMEIALNGCKQRDIEQLYIITSFPDFPEILQKHYQAKICPGKTLLIDLVQ